MTLAKGGVQGFLGSSPNWAKSFIMWSGQDLQCRIIISSKFCNILSCYCFTFTDGVHDFTDQNVLVNSRKYKSQKEPSAEQTMPLLSY